MTHNVVKDYNQFIGMNMESYRGQWVALFNGDVVAHGKSFKSVVTKAEKKLPKRSKPFLAKIPGKQVMLF